MLIWKSSLNGKYHYCVNGLWRRERLCQISLCIMLWEKKLLECLKPEIAAFIDPSIFCMSVMGPDPFFCYLFFARRFRRGIQLRGKIMHQEKTRAVLIELARRSHSREMFSFLAGFLCHFALDSVAHPYINGKAKSRAYITTRMRTNKALLFVFWCWKRQRTMIYFAMVCNKIICIPKYKITARECSS